MVFEVACALEPLVLDREAEKWRTYADVAADLALQNPSYATMVVPVVVGTLGVIGNLKERLRQ